VTCDSGIALPADGTLRDAHWWYAQATCGYVVRFAPEGWHKYGQRELDRHIQQAHPARWADIERIRRMSED